MNPSVRKAHTDDILRLSEIRASVRENRLDDPNAVTHADYVRLIDRGELWLWEERGRILGFSAGNGDDGTIWALFVDPAHEGKGIGRALIAQACEVVRRAGHDRAVLSTEPGTRAERFYRAQGWIDEGRNAKGEIIFYKTLSPAG